MPTRTLKPNSWRGVSLSTSLLPIAIDDTPSRKILNKSHSKNESFSLISEVVYYIAGLHNLRFVEFSWRNAVERNIKSYSFILITNSNLLLLVFHFFSFNI